MAFNFPTTEKAQAPQAAQTTFIVEVTKVMLTDSNKRVMFDAKVNGVSIRGFGFLYYTNSDNVENTMIQFPQRKGKDDKGKDKYFNIVWFPVSRDLRKNIEEQITNIINQMLKEAEAAADQTAEQAPTAE